MRPLLLLLAVTAALGCDSTGDSMRGPLDASADALAGGDGGWPVDASSDDAGPPLPDPEPREPCALDRCWDTALANPRCVTRTVEEDFSSGRYDAHDYAAMLWAEVPTALRVERTGGDWQPAILIIESDGTVLYDGAVGRTRAGLSVEAVLDGRTGDRAEVVITSATDLSVSVFVTGWEAVDSGFAGGPPVSATYRLSVTGSCPGTMMRECVVNGWEVGDPACAWIHYVGLEVVPRLEGTREEALDAAAAVTWWSLKEGVLSLSNPIVYSNCNFTTGDMRIGPLDTCPDDRAWQVGMSGVQVPGRELSALEDTARRLFSEEPDAVLDRTAREAALDDDTRAAVVASTGDLRRSWLLRATAIGFTLQAPTVVRECVTETRAWCYGTGWEETARYAPDRSAALGSIDDLRALLDALAP